MLKALPNLVFSRYLIRILIDFQKVFKGLGKGLKDPHKISKGSGKNSTNAFQRNWWEFQMTFKRYGKEFNWFGIDL